MSDPSQVWHSANAGKDFRADGDGCEKGFPHQRTDGGQPEKGMGGFVHQRAFDGGAVDVQEQMEHLDALIAAFEAESHAPARAQLTQILQTVLAFHADGLRRMLERIFESERAGQTLIDDLARDPVISSLLVLHDLHPEDTAARVEQALEQVRPALAAHGGRVELVAMTDGGGVLLRLEGNCHGCPSSRMTLQQTIEQAIRAAAPEITEIQVEGLTDSPAPATAGFVPVSAVTASALGGGSPPRGVAARAEQGV